MATRAPLGARTHPGGEGKLLLAGAGEAKPDSVVDPQRREQLEYAPDPPERHELFKWFADQQRPLAGLEHGLTMIIGDRVSSTNDAQHHGNERR